MAGDLSPDDQARVRATMIREGKLAALILYRACTGASLPEAKAFIDALADGVPAAAPECPPRRLTDAELAGLRRLIVRDGNVAAVQAYRTATGASLPAAVAFVQAVQRQAGEGANPPQELLDLAAAHLANVGDMSAIRARFEAERGIRPEDEILAALGRARRLLDLAYDLADAERDGRPAGDAIARLRRDCPGFSDNAYRSAMGYGFYISR
jgi:hypothetical protein